MILVMWSVTPNISEATLLFRPEVNYSVGNPSYSVAIGDLDGDGDLDLAVAKGGSLYGDTVSVLLGNGDGTFQDAVNYGAGNTSSLHSIS